MNTTSPVVNVVKVTDAERKALCCMARGSRMERGSGGEKSYRYRDPDERESRRLRAKSICRLTDAGLITGTGTHMGRGPDYDAIVITEKGRRFVADAFSSRRFEY